MGRRGSEVVFSEPVTIHVGEGDLAEPLTLPLRGPSVLQGRVLSPAGSGVSGASVRIKVYPAGSGLHPTEYLVSSGADGSFRQPFPPDDAATLEVHVSAPGFDEVTIRGAPAEELVVVLR